MLGGRRVVMNEGECAGDNDFNLPHSVANHYGATDRVHLVIDCVLNDWLRALFAEIGPPRSLRFRLPRAGLEAAWARRGGDSRTGVGGGNPLVRKSPRSRPWPRAALLPRRARVSASDSWRRRAWPFPPAPGSSSVNRAPKEAVERTQCGLGQLAEIDHEARATVPGCWSAASQVLASTWRSSETSPCSSGGSGSMPKTRGFMIPGIICVPRTRCCETITSTGSR